MISFLGVYIMSISLTESVELQRIEKIEMTEQDWEKFLSIPFPNSEE